MLLRAALPDINRQSAAKRQLFSLTTKQGTLHGLASYCDNALEQSPLEKRYETPFSRRTVCFDRPARS